MQHYDIPISPPAQVEEYRPIPGWPDYRAGSFGTVWSRKYGNWRRLRPGKKAKGYLFVILYRNKTKTSRHVHHLVLEAFVGPCPTGMQGCHFPDPNPANCRLDNVRWATREDNEADKVKHGTSQHGERNHRVKLSESAVLEILRLCEVEGWTQKRAGAKFGVSDAAAGHIVRGNRWQHLLAG